MSLIASTYMEVNRKFQLKKIWFYSLLCKLNSMLFVFFFSVTDLSGLNIQHAGKVWQMKKIYTETSQWKAILMNSLWLIGLVVVICLLSIYRANLSKSRHWYRECDLSLYKSVTIHDSSLVTFLLLDRVIWFWWKTENIFL